MIVEYHLVFSPLQCTKKVVLPRLLREVKALSIEVGLFKVESLLQSSVSKAVEL